MQQNEQERPARIVPVDMRVENVHIANTVLLMQHGIPAEPAQRRGG